MDSIRLGGILSDGDLRQLYQAPLAEYSILHLQILSGGDYFANFPQWLSFAACGVAVSLIIKEFDKDLKTQFLGIVFSATIPMAIVQATGTQNDLIVSVFVLSFFYYWLRAVKTNNWSDFIWLGVSLGLAVLAKGTAYFYCFPIGLIFSGLHFFSLNPSKRKRFVKQLTVVLVLAAAFNFAHFVRNYSLFGSPVSTGESKCPINLTPKMFLANLVRNYSVHLGTKSESYNEFLKENIGNFWAMS